MFLFASFCFFFFNDTATTEIYTLSLHDALPIRISAGPRPSKRKRRYVGLLMPLRRQNSGMVNASRSVRGLSVRTRRLLLSREARPCKANGSLPTAQGDPAPTEGS